MCGHLWSFTIPASIDPHNTSFHLVVITVILILKIIEPRQRISSSPDYPACLWMSCSKQWMILIFLFFLAMPYGLWDLASPPRDQIRVSCIGSAVLTTGPPEKSPNHLYLYLNCEKPGKHSKAPLYTPKVNYQSFGSTQQSAARLSAGPPLFPQPARGLSTIGFQNPRCYFLL